METRREIASLIRAHLRELSVHIGARPTGSESNRRAQQHIARAFEEAGLEVEQQAFGCLDWQPGGIELTLAGERLEASTNPFSPPCDAAAGCVFAASLDELRQADIHDRIVVLHGALSAEPLWPKNFKFFVVEEHQAVIRALEAGNPKAVIAISHAAGRSAPLIEDGDFTIPSATAPAETGRALLANREATAALRIDSAARESQSANVIGRRAGRSGKKIVVCAHFDTKPGTPGALDNASGVAAVLALAQTLKARNTNADLEFVAFNGEDYYSAAGQVAYLDRYGGEISRIALVVNVDGVGWKESKNSIAFFECPAPLREEVERIRRNYPDIVEVEPWPQGDHMIFAMQGAPSIAFSSEGAAALVGSVIHTKEDTMDLVSGESAAGVVCCAGELIAQVGGV